MSDPVGATGIQGDQATFQALGCHGITVTTGLLIADSARIDDIQEVDADWLVDQARLLLEDMAVSAIKVGAICSMEQASAIAEIVSDYPDLPFILDPFLSTMPDSGLLDDDMLLAIREILASQATVLMLSQVELARMAETWREGGGDMLAADVAELTAGGCGHVLVTCTSGAQTRRSNTLYGDSGVLATLDWEHLAGPFVGAGSTLSGALAACMAHGATPEQAVRHAHQFTAGALAHAQRFGMGKLIPNRFFGQPSTPVSFP